MLEGDNEDIIYLDFAKASDTLPHRGLETKLHGYDIEGKILALIQEYLSNRRICAC